jgi:Na+-translocating ferredoxin:NAD+ oxidoreductase RnfD subunit
VAQTLAWQLGWRGAVDPLRAAFSGSLLIGIFFYATDPISASSTNEGRWIYGAFIGAMSVLIATFSAWPAGTMFAILLANMFAPLLDHGIKRLKPTPAKPAAGAKPAGAKPAPAKAAAAGGTPA